jgi:arsenate reductase
MERNLSGLKGVSMKMKVLFICEHNSARSQMAEAFLNRLGAGSFTAESAGLEPGALNPLAVEVMAELGYDISGNSTDSVFDFFKEGRKYDLVVKVCDPAQSERCPIFPSAKLQLVWAFPDPSRLTGTWEEKLAGTRVIRDLILAKIRCLVEVFALPNADGT